MSRPSNWPNQTLQQRDLEICMQEKMILRTGRFRKYCILHNCGAYLATPDHGIHIALTLIIILLENLNSISAACICFVQILIVQFLSSVSHPGSHFFVSLYWIFWTNIKWSEFSLGWIPSPNIWGNLNVK